MRRHSTIETPPEAFARQLRQLADLVESGTVNRWQVDVIFGTVDREDSFGAMHRDYTGERLLHFTIWAPHRLAEEMQSRRPAALSSPQRLIGSEGKEE